MPKPRREGKARAARGRSGRKRRPPGRPPKGTPRADLDILAAASDLFGACGFDGVSVRSVARHAHVDPALIWHRYKSKENLFSCAVIDQIHPEASRGGASAPSGGGSGEALIYDFLGFWDAPARRRAFGSLFRSALSHEWIFRRLLAFGQAEVRSRMNSSLPEAEVRTRAGLIATQLLGLGLARYVVRIPSVASMSRGALARRIGPNLDRYLGALPTDPRAEAVPTPAPSGHRP